MKRLLRLLLHGVAGLCFFALAHAQLWGRWTPDPPALPPQVELSWAQAMADGALSPAEIAVHYAPEIHAAVNVLLSDHGRGDFITRVDFDGDLRAVNNWAAMEKHPLPAAVYWSVQETDTHYFAGYYFYHPRDDAEIWLDRHENDMEGIMLAIPKAADGFAPPERMYVQGHGRVQFYAGEQLALEGDRAVVYIAPNGTLSHAGHSVESAAEHSVYWAVGRSGVRYYHGGTGMEPATFNGAFTANPCPYELLPLADLWARRNGPYGDTALFASYGALRGDDFRANAANPPWAWRNKNVYGYGGSFLSDPAWTFSRGMADTELSCVYLSNPFADWRITVESVTLPAGEDAFTLCLKRDGWLLSDPAWWRFHPLEDGRWAVTIGDDVRRELWCAAPRSARWSLTVTRPDGSAIPGAILRWQMEYLPQ